MKLNEFNEKLHKYFNQEHKYFNKIIIFILLLIVQKEFL
jgi:hypothetical protein